VDDGTVPQSLQKPLGALEKRGNPWGKLEKKRAEWIRDLAADVPVKVLDGKSRTRVLFFVDSMTSFDDRMQSVARATAVILHRTGADFGILGKDEKDSGHEVRRFGEEMLFQDLRAHNTAMIMASGAELIVTSDPHAYNALRNDYEAVAPVEHISQYMVRMLREGKLHFKPLENNGRVYTYHDPCYLGRHNNLYDPPRQLLNSVSGLELVEMSDNRKDSLCCGGGGGRVWMETPKGERFSDLRLDQAVDTGAQVLATACPYCISHFEESRLSQPEDQATEIKDITEIILEVL
jgi:Fe-S oxidoreductase